MSHLKRKLDTLKSTLPDLDESPIPSPSADAPSPTGSESPFHGLDMAGPDFDDSVMDDEAEPPAPSPLSSLGGSPRRPETVGQNDNREVEDMELSEEEIDSGGIIGEEWAGDWGLNDRLHSEGFLNAFLKDICDYASWFAV